MGKKTIGILVSAVLLCSNYGCAHKNVHPGVSTTSPIDNSYMDLIAGGRLRILVPVLKSGGYRIATGSAQPNGNTMVFSAANLTGYEVSYYEIEGRRHGNVRLRFTSAEITKNGKTVHETSAPALAFPLPSIPEHIRLVYLVRNSPADHNMAIVASKNLDALNVFTSRLEKNPAVCKSDAVVFCCWVPAGIAVRPE